MNTYQRRWTWKVFDNKTEDTPSNPDIRNFEEVAKAYQGLETQQQRLLAMALQYTKNGNNSQCW